MDEYLHIHAMAESLRSVKEILTEAEYKNYRNARNESPDISPQSWALVFIDAEKLEARYQEEKRHA